jgi:hypothetical protein
MSDAMHSLGVQSSVLGLNDRIALFGEFIIDTIGNVGPSNMMLGEYIKPVLAGPKTLAIIGLPLLVGSLGLVVRSMRQEGLYIIGGFVFGFFVLVLVFGDRLWLHHASSVLPVLYVGLTLAIDRLASIIRRPAAAGAIVAVLVMPFIVANAASRQELFMRLEATGGVGLSSDAITRYAKDSVRESPNIYRLFPDWGVSMPFEMVTRGSLPVTAEFSPDFARSLLCSGRDVEVALSPAARTSGLINGPNRCAGPRRNYQTTLSETESLCSLLHAGKLRIALVNSSLSHFIFSTELAI